MKSKAGGCSEVSTIHPLTLTFYFNVNMGMRINLKTTHIRIRPELQKPTPSFEE